MKIIKGVLEEELKNSLRMQDEYEKALAALPRGVLVKKYVKGYQYYYLMPGKGTRSVLSTKSNFTPGRSSISMRSRRTGQSIGNCWEKLRGRSRFFGER
jgi:hypothetical protein